MKSIKSSILAVLLLAMLVLPRAHGGVTCDPKNAPEAWQLTCIDNAAKNFYNQYTETSFPYDGCNVRAVDILTLIKQVQNSCNYTMYEVWVNGIFSPGSTIKWGMHTTAAFCASNSVWYVVDPALIDGVLSYSDWFSLLHSTGQSTARFDNPDPIPANYANAVHTFYRCFGQENRAMVSCNGNSDCIKAAKAVCDSCETQHIKNKDQRVTLADHSAVSCRMVPDGGWNIPRAAGANIPNTPPPPPTKVGVSQDPSDSNSIQVNWSPDGVVSDVAMGKIASGTIPDLSCSGDAPINMGSGSSWTFSNLAPGTYTVGVCSSNSFGQFSSTVVNFITIEPTSGSCSAGGCASGYYCSSTGDGGGECIAGFVTANLSCSTTSNCLVGNRCANVGSYSGLCVAGNDSHQGDGCSANSDCNNNFYCGSTGSGSGTCQPGATFGGSVGSPCSSDLSCAIGNFCGGDGFGGGTTCQPGNDTTFGSCSGNWQCAMTSHCASSGNGWGFCSPGNAAVVGAPCAQTLDCAVNQFCAANDQGGSSTCQPGNENTGSCGPSEECSVGYYCAYPSNGSNPSCQWGQRPVTSVALSKGNGTFQSPVNYAAGSSPYYVAVADLNGDGKPDVVVANHGGSSVSVFLGNGDGTFQNEVTYPTGIYPAGLVIADLNRDGKLDLAIVNSHDNNLVILLGNGDGTFTGWQKPVLYATGNDPLQIAVGDFNGDGIPDLVVSSINQTVSVLLGNGDGTFASQVTYFVGAAASTNIAVGDFNRDGNLDIVVTNSDGSITILFGNGDGTFKSPVASPGGGAGYLAAADLNGDGILDLIVINKSNNTVGVLTGRGDGTFNPAMSYATGSYPINVAIGDFNGDGKLDLAVVNFSGNSVSILSGNGDGTFQNQSTYPAGNRPYYIAVGDFNNDQKIDLAIAGSLDKTLRILLGN